jgi:hypothetical protein
MNRIPRNAVARADLHEKNLSPSAAASLSNKKICKRLAMSNLTHFMSGSSMVAPSGAPIGRVLEGAVATLLIV